MTQMVPKLKELKKLASVSEVDRYLNYSILEHIGI